MSACKCDLRFTLTWADGAALSWLQKERDITLGRGTENNPAIQCRRLIVMANLD